MCIDHQRSGLGRELGREIAKLERGVQAPRALGWLLVAGGIGYLLSGILKYGIEGAPGPLVEGLALVASVGEFWMIGYLLIMGIRPQRPVAKEVRA